jgi:hypothetical protein
METKSRHHLGLFEMLHDVIDVLNHSLGVLDIVDIDGRKAEVSDTIFKAGIDTVHVLRN